MNDTLRFTVEGMTCGGCVRRVRAALEAVPGVDVENLAAGEEAEIRVAGGAVDAGTVARAVRDAGYRAVFADAGDEVAAL